MSEGIDTSGLPFPKTVRAKKAAKPLKRGAPPRRYTPLSPVSKKKQSQERRKADRAFQALFSGKPCAVEGLCSRGVSGHHSKRRRNLETRHDESNGIPLCRKHHSELHDLGDYRFFKKYPHVPKPEENGEALWLSVDNSQNTVENVETGDE